MNDATRTLTALRHLHRNAIIRGEDSVASAVLSAIATLLGIILSAILSPGRNTPVDLTKFPPPQVWDRLVQERIVPALGEVFDDRSGTVYDSDRYRTEYLKNVPSRLTNFPEQAFYLVRSTLEEGQRAGESIPKLRDRVADVLDISSGHWGWRATRIARTETGGAYNGGRFSSAVAESGTTGVVMEKQWLSTDDDRTRPTHDDADDQVRPLMDPFEVGGALMMFPGDPTGPGEEVINCRCALLVRVVGR